MIDDGNQKKNSNSEPMPEDFWEMVRAARARAIAEVEKKRRCIYESFHTEEVKSGKRIPMPSGYLQETEMSHSNEAPAQAQSFANRIEQTPDVAPPIEPLLHPGSGWADKDGLDPDDAPPIEPPLHHQIEDQQIEEPTVPSSIPAPNFEIAPASTESLNESGDACLIDASLIDADANRRDLSFKEAALLILNREGRPMSAKEIVSIALEEGMLKSGGKTPDASLAGQIYTDIHRNRYSPFAIVGPRTYALKPTLPRSDAESVEDESRFAANNPSAGGIEGSPLPGNFQSGSQAKMSYKQAAVYLLERESRPMTAKEIVKTAIDEGLIESSGKTPDATLAGQLYTEMQRSKGSFPVKLIGPRTYALADWYK